MEPIGSVVPKEIEHAQRLVSLMDDQFKIPILNIRFGLDPIIGLVPWVGDAISFIISVLVIKALIQAGFPRKLIGKLVWNIVLDLLVGAIPFVGDVWDFFFKANRRNLKIARQHFESHSGK